MKGTPHPSPPPVNGGRERVAAVIVAAGNGSRMGRPKQFLPLAGRPMLHWTVDAFLQVPELADIVVVLSPGHLKAHGRDWSDRRVHAVAGGKTRLDSVRRGLSALRGGSVLVAVHDGARPLVTPELIRSTLEAAREYGAAVPGVPIRDTIKEVARDLVVATPERSRLFAAQTPQCYRSRLLQAALRKYSGVKDATDESQLVEAAGTRVRLVPSTPENLKVTTPEDLVLAETLLRRQSAPLRSFRTGFGYDIHRLAPGRTLYLGGLRLDHPKGFVGHSDGDAVLHAVCDALLGAAGAGELGQYFPPGDPETKAIRSPVMARKVLALLAEKGAAIEHVDVTIIAEQPKLRPLYGRLRESIAAAIGVSAGRVNVKSKSKEGLGETGRGDAIECHAVATLVF